MNNFTKALLDIEEGNFSLTQLVSLLVLIESNIEIDTISEMARKENKTPRGIRTSNQYQKIKIGKQVMAIKGLTNNKLPF